MNKVDLATALEMPVVVLDVDRLQTNLGAMHDLADAKGMAPATPFQDA